MIVDVVFLAATYSISVSLHTLLFPFLFLSFSVFFARLRTLTLTLFFVVLFFSFFFSSGVRVDYTIDMFLVLYGSNTNSSRSPRWLFHIVNLEYR